MKPDHRLPAEPGRAAPHPARLAVGIIGAGKAGTALGAALRRAGHQVVAASAVSDADFVCSKSCAETTPPWINS